MTAIINLNTNQMAVIDKWGKQMEWDLNTENFPKWVDLTTMTITSALNGIIVYKEMVAGA